MFLEKNAMANPLMRHNSPHTVEPTKLILEYVLIYNNLPPYATYEEDFTMSIYIKM